MTTWKIDREHSTVEFEVQHMMVSKVRGRFDQFTVHIEAEDLENLSDANIAFQLKTASINTRHKERDKHLKSVDFFDVVNFPTIKFKST